jgi:hypothetical protein
MDHFLAPGPNSHFKTGDTISFLVEDMPDEDDQNVNANLHKADGRLVLINTFFSFFMPLPNHTLYTFL